MTLIREFRHMVSKEIELKQGGTLYAFTEVAFPYLPMYYTVKGKPKKDLDVVDGLLLVVSSGIIKDAAFFEMKSNDKILEIEQVKRYLALAQELGVEIVLTY